MAFYPEAYLISTFPGINDIPREPTSAKAGNGAHLAAVHNELVYGVGAEFVELKSQKVGECSITATGYHIAKGERLVVVDDGVNDNMIYLPTTELQPGTEVFIMHVPQGRNVDIRADDNAQFRYQGSVTQELRFVAVFEFASLIYIGQPTGIDIDFGWVPSNAAAFTGS